ncbi:MAG: hypothetical protein K0S04_1843 [Herbinix sp.]|jgi:hypothetical protein|nr:hypothetical protein [Herbinix sp.]
MSENHLAIANIPIQPWGKLYSEADALNIGTIFQDLNKPFFAADAVLESKSPLVSGNEEKSQAQLEREQLMTKINELGFFLDDLTLYLDTHEKDTQAMQLYHEKSQEFAGLRKQFAQDYYPLSRLCIPDGMHENEANFCWLEGPMPWEGACV